MTTKARYTTREQIVADIDKWRVKAAKHISRAGNLYTAADQMREESRKKKTHGARQRLVNSAKNADEEAGYQVEYAARIRGGPLKQLSQKLAEFDTETLPGVTDDKSVEGL
jgi:hypothetical protein